MQPLVRSSQTGYWIPACAGMTDSALQLSDHVARSLCGRMRNISSSEKFRSTFQCLPMQRVTPDWEPFP